MFKIGCHLSSSRGYAAMGREAVSIGANTFQYFTRNPRGGAIKPLDLGDVAEYLEYASGQGLFPALAHAPYTMNLCSDKESIRDFALNVMREDLQRLEHVPGSMYNFHPGSHVGQGTAAGIGYVVRALNEALQPGQGTVVLLETMAGKGSELGGSFEELREIIDGVELNGRLGVCLDTCHVFDAGYDIVSALDGVLEEFDRVIGLGRLRAVHINDSMNASGSRKDRHQKIGQGSIGLDAMARIINHPALRELPFYLETPNDLDGYRREIALLKGLYNG